MDDMIYVDGNPDCPLPADRIPDLGSLVCQTSSFVKWFNPATKKFETHQIRNYYGLSADKDKLPMYDNLATGSSCLFVDTGDLCFYSHTERQWVDQ